MFAKQVFNNYSVETACFKSNSLSLVVGLSDVLTAFVLDFLYHVSESAVVDVVIVHGLQATANLP